MSDKQKFTETKQGGPMKSDKVITPDSEKNPPPKVDKSSKSGK